MVQNHEVILLYDPLKALVFSYVIRFKCFLELILWMIQNSNFLFKIKITNLMPFTEKGIFPLPPCSTTICDKLNMDEPLIGVWAILALTEQVLLTAIEVCTLNPLCFKRVFKDSPPFIIYETLLLERHQAIEWKAPWRLTWLCCG